MPRAAVWAISCTAIWIVVITAIVLLSVSFSTLEPTEYGLAINGYFVKFPNTVIAVRFVSEEGAQLPVRSSDGLTITLDVSFEYKLIQNELPQLYMKFADQTEDPISKIAREAVRVAASQFEATNFFTSRNNISLAMFNELDSKLEAVHCQLNSFQLLNIKLPDKFDAAIQLTEVTRQNIATAQQQQVQATIEAETQVQAAAQQATIITTKANTEANATIVQGLAEATSILLRAQRLADGYRAVANNVTFTPEQLLAYAWIQALSTTQAKLTFNVEKPAGVDF